MCNFLCRFFIETKFTCNKESKFSKIQCNLLILGKHSKVLYNLFSMMNVLKQFRDWSILHVIILTRYFLQCEVYLSFFVLRYYTLGEHGQFYFEMR